MKEGFLIITPNLTLLSKQGDRKIVLFAEEEDALMIISSTLGGGVPVEFCVEEDQTDNVVDWEPGMCVTPY